MSSTCANHIDGVSYPKSDGTTDPKKWPVRWKNQCWKLRQPFGPSWNLTTCRFSPLGWDQVRQDLEKQLTWRILGTLGHRNTYNVFPLQVICWKQPRTNTLSLRFQLWKRSVRNDYKTVGFKTVLKLLLTRDGSIWFFMMGWGVPVKKKCWPSGRG